MAGSEIYRVEIPIIVEDQTEAPLKQAEQRINRLEQSAQKTNNRIRKMFGRPIRLSIGAIDKAWPVIKGIQTRLRGLTARAWKITLQAKDKVTGTIKSIFRTLTSPLALLGMGAGATAAIYGPLKIAGEMEQARIAMDYFMGSAEEGKRALEELLAFAATTPFEFPALQEATIMLMGADYTFDQAKRALRAFGDAAGMTGAGMQGMRDAMLGFTQIAAAGTLNLQDLRQVALNLRVPLTAFAEELGVAKEQMGDIGKAGIPAAKAMEAIVRTLEKRYIGGMEKLSKSLLGLVSTFKDTARLTVSAFGTGMADPVKRILADMLGMADYTSESYRKVAARLEDFGRRVGEYFERVYNRVKQFWGELSADLGFQKLDFGDKIIYILNLALDKISTWLDGEGGKKVQSVFIKLGEIAAKAWLTGLKGMVKGAVSSLAHGNILGGIGLLAGAGLLGGGLLLRGAWGIGKGIFGAGKWLFGKLRPAATTAAVAEEAATGAKAAGLLSRIPKLGGVSRVLGKLAWPLAAVAGIVDIATAKDKIAASGRAAGALGGTALGAKAGAAIGTAIAPGLGTAVGGAVGGLGGGIAGAFGGEAIVKNFDKIRSWGSDTWDAIKQKASNAWSWISTNVTFESLAKGAGYVYGYLEETIFNGSWWQSKWESVKTWASNAWSGMVDIWNSAKEIIGSTVFNGDWWLAKWEDTKTWASNAWSTATEIWESVKTTISDTLFNKKWWDEKWDAVKKWASNTWDTIKGEWDEISKSFSAGREAGRRAAKTPVEAHVLGGILTRPHLGLVAEAGPEAIIPLSARMRSRALALYEETGRRLGVRPYAEGGFAGPIPALAVSGVAPAPPTATINMHFDLAGLVGQVVVNNQGDIDSAIDRITGAIADNLRGIFQNMAKK